MLTSLHERLIEVGKQFQQEGYIWDTLRGIVAQLDRLQIPYAVVGGLALQHHGLLRTTDDGNILLTSDADVQKLHAAVRDRGYTPKSATSRHLRDDVTRLRIEFLVSGEYPGDGKPKPVSFPNPADVSEPEDGIQFVNLRTFITLKLASAKSAAHRMKDRTDVFELLHRLGLKPDFADQLDPYVQQEFRELAALPSPTARDDE